MAGSRSSPLTNALVAAASILFAALLFGILEGVLRLAEFGEPDASRTSRLKYQQIYFPTLVDDRRPNGSAVLRTDDERLPFQEILKEKPANGFRVFTFGGSATAGLGHSPNVSFAHHLDQMLETALPNREVEVVNLGIVALASKQVALLVAEVAQNYDPDALVVYSGNNEFLETHAEKYAKAHATPMSRARDLLIDTHVFRFIDQAIRGGPETPSLADPNLSRDDLRLTQARIIEDIEMNPGEIEAVVDRYGANLERMQASAGEHSVPLVLMTVASNWEWRGRRDLPEGWLDELLGSEGGETPERLVEARRRVTEELEVAEANERYAWFYKRARIAEAQGDWKAARQDYRASMNEDPHLRRGLDSMGQRLLEVAGRGPAIPLDTVSGLASEADHGIVGFDEFYDYVHFTPKGAAQLGALVFEALVEAEVLPADTDLDTDAYLRAEFAWIDERGVDAFALDDWMGIGFEPGNISNRDLWKYDRMVEELDARLEANPRDLEALVYRGNASYFRVDGGDEAERYYRAALDLAPENSDIRDNLERLRSEARP